MVNACIITSILRTPDTPLSYTNTRSVYTPKERFEQTKKTIQSIRDHIPDTHIVLVECSKLLDEEIDYFKSNTDHLINLYDDDWSRNAIYSTSKSFGEWAMMKSVFHYILNCNIQFESVYKISGRYWITDRFDYTVVQRERNTALKVPHGGISTRLYKLDFSSIVIFNAFLESKVSDMLKFKSFEDLFKEFLITLPQNNVKYLHVIGVAGNIAVDGYLIDE